MYIYIYIYLYVYAHRYLHVTCVLFECAEEDESRAPRFRDEYVRHDNYYNSYIIIPKHIYIYTHVFI